MKDDSAPSRYLDVVPILKDQTTGFATSPEHRLWGEQMDDLPGVVAAAFAQYLARIALDGSEMGIVKAGVEALSELASWGDGEVDTMLRDEVFDNLGDDVRAIEVLRQMMSERLQRLYDHWIESSA